MTCLRCHGFMVQHRLYDLLDAYIHTDVWHCTNCGDMTDKVILNNRQTQTVHSDTPTINPAP